MVIIGKKRRPRNQLAPEAVKRLNIGDVSFLNSLMSSFKGKAERPFNPAVRGQKEGRLSGDFNFSKIMGKRKIQDDPEGGLPISKRMNLNTTDVSLGPFQYNNSAGFTVGAGSKPIKMPKRAAPRMEGGSSSGPVAEFTFAPAPPAPPAPPFNPQVETPRTSIGGHLAGLAASAARLRRVVTNPIDNAGTIADEIDQGFPNLQQGIANSADSIYSLASDAVPRLQSGLQNVWSSSQPHLNRLKPYYGHIGAAALLGGGLYLAGKAIRNRIRDSSPPPRRRRRPTS